MITSTMVVSAEAAAAGKAEMLLVLAGWRLRLAGYTSNGLEGNDHVKTMTKGVCLEHWSTNPTSL